MTIGPPPIYYFGGHHGGHWRAVTPSHRNPDQASGAAELRAEDIAACAAADRAAAIKDGAIADAGIRAGEIVGFRAWLVNDDGKIRSMAFCVEWQPGTPMTGTPFATFIGVHAFKTARQAWRCYGSYDVLLPLVFGTVFLWGDVIEHEQGYRAEYAAVRSIDKVIGPWPGTWKFWREPKLLGELRQRYGVSGRAVS